MIGGYITNRLRSVNGIHMFFLSKPSFKLGYLHILMMKNISEECMLRYTGAPVEKKGSSYFKG